MTFNKHWKSISVALLVALTGIGMANHNNVHANANNDDNTSEQIYNSQTSNENVLVKSDSAQSKASQLNLAQQANSLHNQIIRNNVSSAPSASSSSNNNMNLSPNVQDFDEFFNDNGFNSDFSDTLTNTKSEANSLSAETSEANQTNHPNYQMSFSSVSNSSAFGYNYYFASSVSNDSTSDSLADSISTDINDNIDDSFNWMNSMDNQMNSEFNAVNDTFGEDNFDNNLFTHQPVLEPESNESSSTNSNSASNDSLNSQNSSNYNNFTVPNNNRAWNYVMSGTNGISDYNDNSNNYSDGSVDNILDQINNLTNELNDDINSIFNDF